jgi:tape measure domain-containing protein
VADISRTIAIIFEGEDRVTIATDKIARTFKEVGVEAGGATTKVGQLDTEIGQLEKKVPAISSLSTALTTLAGSLIVKAFIDANVELEKFTKSMTATTGSAQAAAEAYAYVSGVSNKLGIETGATADSFAKFAAATKGTALEGDGAKLIFEAFAGTMSRLGSSSADINGAFVQLAQGISKGKFELEDLKSIAERVPGFFDQLAKSLNVSTGELFKMISAGQIGAVEIAKFAAVLNEGLAGAKFDGYVNSMARLRNAIDEAFRDVGKAGAFDALIATVKIGAASIVGATTTFTLFGEVIAAVFAKLSLGQAFDFGNAVSEAMDKAAKATDGAGRAAGELFGIFDKQGPGAAAAIADLPKGFSDARFEAARLSEEAKKTDEALKALGLDPKKFEKDVGEITRAFKRLLDDPSLSGDTILAGLKKTLASLKTEGDVQALIGDLSQRFSEGGISANQYAEQIKLTAKRLLELGDGFKINSKDAKAQEDQIRKNEAAAQKAEEATRKYQLELEKLASNERIKNLELKINLNIAQLQADTERIKATFTSIDNTVKSTGDLLGDLFGLFKNYDQLSFAAIRVIEQQIELENKRRQEALNLQKRLTDAQIEQMKARTRALDRSDALIKVDGAGLQPHLEAFMWEILKTIQVKVNQDGLEMLLGI